MGIEFDLPEGATPIDPDEAIGLLLSIGTQAELNTFEAGGILVASNWALGNRRFVQRFLTERGMRNLHRRMFASVWRWAGTYRVTQKSIGVEAFRIATEVNNLVADTECWIEFHSYAPAEIAARFHHRLVQIHPFPNGNGRHARLATDLLCHRQGWPLSDWGASDLGRRGEARYRYLQALRLADAHNLTPLVEFMAIELPLSS